MTKEEFNEKYKDYIEEGFEGLEFDIPELTRVLDEMFPDLIQIPGFKFAQIKFKFNSVRFYATGISNYLATCIEFYLKYLDDYYSKLRKIS